MNKQIVLQRILAKAKLFALAGISISVVSCSSGEKTSPESAAQNEAKTEENIYPAQDKGVGPVKVVKLDPVNPALAAKGKEIFDSKCAACHKMGERYVGPALGGVTERRTPEYIMNMILNSQEMIQKSPTAKALFEEFLTPMPNQNMNEEQARAVLEHFRSLSQEKSISENK